MNEVTSRFFVQEFLGLTVYICISVEISDLCLRSCFICGPTVLDLHGERYKQCAVIILHDQIFSVFILW